MNSLKATLIYKLCSEKNNELSIKNRTWHSFDKAMKECAERKIVVYGTGVMFDYFCTYYLEDYPVDYAVDRNCYECYKKNGVNVYPIQKLYKEEVNPIILVTFFEGAKEVVDQLQKKGFKYIFFLPLLEKSRLTIKADMLRYRFNKPFRKEIMIEVKEKNEMGMISKRVTERYKELLHLYKIVNILIDKTDDDDLKIAQIKGIFTLRHFNSYVPDIENPKTFNEKIQHNNIFNKNPLYTMVSDKLQLKEYVSEKIGAQYVVPLLGVWDSPEEVNFDSLPNEFVLKATSGGDSNRVIIIQDKTKVNINDIISKMKNWMPFYDNDYFYSFNWSFKEIPQRIIAEKLLPIEEDTCYDYKVHCFHGEPQFIHVVNQNPHEVTVFDTEWNYVPLRTNYPEIHFDVKKPHNLGKILDLSRILSKEFEYVRVDFYILNEDIYIGELTLTTLGGLVPFKEYEYDLKWGGMI